MVIIDELNDSFENALLKNQSNLDSTLLNELDFSKEQLIATNPSVFKKNNQKQNMIDIELLENHLQSMLQNDISPEVTDLFRCCKVFKKIVKY